MNDYEALWSDGVTERWSAESDASALADVDHWSPDRASGAHVTYLERIDRERIIECAFCAAGEGMVHTFEPAS